MRHLLILLLLCCCGCTAPERATLATRYRGWETHAAPGYTLRYPPGWESIAAGTDTTATEQSRLLDPAFGEVHKVTFRERGGMWPGEVTVRVIAPPAGVAPEAWIARHLAGSEDLEEVGSGALGGQAATRVLWFAFDRTVAELFCPHAGRIISVQHDHASPNDPDFSRHAEQYRFLLDSFRFTD